MTYLFLLACAAVFLVVGWRTSDEVFQIAALVTGALFGLWGVAIAPIALQIALEVALIVSVFSVCVRCLESDSNRC